MWDFTTNHQQTTNQSRALSSTVFLSSFMTMGKNTFSKQYLLFHVFFFTFTLFAKAHEYTDPCTPPTAFTMTGGGTYCTGSPMPSVGLSNSEIGVNYTLQLGGNNVGNNIPGTGAALDFGAQAASGYYTVLATDATSGCTVTSTNGVFVVEKTLPNEIITPTTQNVCNNVLMTPIDISPTVNNALSTFTPSGLNINGGAAQPYFNKGVFFDLTNTSTDRIILTKVFPRFGSNLANSQNGLTIYNTIASNAAATPNYTDATAWEKNTGWEGVLPTAFAQYYFPSGVDLEKPIILEPNETRGFYIVGETASTFMVVYRTNSGVTQSVTTTSFMSGALKYDAKNASNAKFGNIATYLSPIAGSFEAPYTLIAYRTITSQVSWTRDNLTNVTGTGVGAAASGNDIFPLNAKFINNTTIPQTTNYQITIQGVNGCSVTQNVSVTVDAPLLVFNITGGGVYCANQTSNATVGLDGSEIGVSYQLKNGSSNVGAAISGTGAAINFGFQTAGNYTVVATRTSSNCSLTMTGNAIVSANAVPSANIVVTNNCGNSVLDLTTSPLGSGGTFLWSNAANTEDITVSNSGTYTITATAANGCTTTASANVAFKAIPVANAGADVTLSCINPGMILMATGGPSYAWNNGIMQGDSISPTVITTYTVTVTSNEGCTAVDDIVVTPNPITICITAELSGSQTIFAKDPANLVLTIVGGVGPYKVVFNNGVSDITVNNYVLGSDLIVTPETSTTYTLVSVKDIHKLNAAVSGFAVVTTIADTTPPTITSSDVTVDACAYQSPFPTAYLPVISDNAVTPPVLSLMSDITATPNTLCVSQTNPNLKYTKVNTRTWKVTDNNGNTATKIQRIYLRDKVAPTAVCKNATVTIAATATSATLTVAAINNGTTDNCTALPSLSICQGGTTCTKYLPSLTLAATLIPAGQTQVVLPIQLRAVDGCSNIGYCSATVTLIKASTMANGEDTNNSTTMSAPTSDAAIEPSEVTTIHGDMKCFPNPFADDLNLQYNLTRNINQVTLKVYDIQGRLVMQSEQGRQSAAFYEMRWNLSDLSSGMYHICLELDGKCQKVERVIMMK